MAPTKFLNLLAISSLAILACSFGSAPVNALSVEGDHFAARHARGHNAIAKRNMRKRETKRCKARTSSSEAPAATSSPDIVAAITSYFESPTTTSSTAVATTATSSGSGSSGSTGNSGNTGGKTGTAWPNGDANPINLFKPASGATYYTWSPHQASKAASSGFKFAAMLWGWKQIGDFTSLVVSGYADTILGMNEPNEPSQSNMSPESGAQLWKTYIEPLKYAGYTLVSPACTSAPSGKVWIQDFITACDGGCTLDAIAVHYYDTSADHFISFIEDYHTTFNKDIWVTEFACQDFNGGAQASMDQIFAFMIKTVQWMDATDYVKFYAWFGAMEDMQNVNPLNRLMTEDGSGLTDLGKWYVGDHA